MARIIKKKRFKRRNFIYRKKVCSFCTDKVKEIDYKDISKLSRFTTERGKIITRRVSGACAKHQRMLAEAVKRARFIALIPYIRK
jgi:small subunit ribosomal protein S18